MQFANVLNSLMQDNGITAYKMHQLFGVSQTTIKNWTSGKSSPADAVLLKIADHFGVSLDYLLAGETPTNDSSGELDPESEKVLTYYSRLNEENKDYIKGEMVRLHREQEVNKGGMELSSTLDDTKKHA